MNIKDTKDTLIVIASIAVIAFVGDALNTKYNMGDKTVICTSPEVEKSLLKLDGITKVKINLKDKTATIYSSVSIPDEDIIDTINKLDYKVTSIEKD